MIKAQRVAAQVSAWLGKSREGRVHSVFARAVNLSWGDALISLVQPEHGMVPGGISAAFTELPCRQGDLIQWDPSCGRLGCIDLSGAVTWENRAPLKRTVSPAVIAQRVAEAAAVVRAQGRGDLARVLATDPPAFPVSGDRLRWSTYAWAPMQALLRAVALGHEAGFAEPLHALIGLGEGLTPSGDDFVLGLMAVMHYGQRPGARRLGLEASRFAGGTTPVSANYLRLAARGGFSERLENLALALLSEGGCEVAAAARALVETGHSSGTDSLVGALLGARLLYTKHELRRAAL